MTQMMGEIAAASREQLHGIEQVGGAVSTMDRVVQQNASLVQESAAAAENMAAQAQRLMESVARFKLEGQEHAADEMPVELTFEPPSRQVTSRLPGRGLLTSGTGTRQ
jgi:methylmalonyl-CoA mutase N-terminal domain/subunit